MQTIGHAVFAEALGMVAAFVPDETRVDFQFFGSEVEMQFRGTSADKMRHGEGRRWLLLDLENRAGGAVTVAQEMHDMLRRLCRRMGVNYEGP